MLLKFRKSILSLALSGAVMISPLYAMDSKEPEQGSLFTEKSFTLDEYLQKSDDFLNTSPSQNLEILNDQIIGANFLGNSEFPNEIRLKIFSNEKLENLYSFAQTCKIAYSFCVSKEVEQYIISPQVKDIIQANNNFRYQALVRGAGGRIERALSPQISLSHIKGLSSAGCLGNGDACLVLAEMDWSAPHLQGKLNHRDGWYNKALNFFPVNTKEANAIFLGKAHHQIRQYPNLPNGASIQYKNLEIAAKSLQCMTDGLLFQIGGLTRCVMEMIWNGQYARIDDSSQPGMLGTQRLRTTEEKRRDFCLLSSLVQHAVKLGINDFSNPMPQHSFKAIEIDQLPHHMPMHQNVMSEVYEFIFALINPKQSQIFLDHGHFDLFMPD